MAGARAQLKFDGLKELIFALRALPDNLAGEAGDIVARRATETAGQISAAYPIGLTGNLKNGVNVEITDAGRYGVRAVVKNSAPHAFIYEHGTEARHYYEFTSGEKHATGRMPAGNVFIPRMIAGRYAMYSDLAELIERYGLQVKRAAA